MGQTNIRTVELSDLTEKEAAMICELVEMMKQIEIVIFNSNIIPLLNREKLNGYGILIFLSES